MMVAYTKKLGKKKAGVWAGHLRKWGKRAAAKAVRREMKKVAKVA